MLGRLHAAPFHWCSHPLRSTPKHEEALTHDVLRMPPEVSLKMAKKRHPVAAVQRLCRPRSSTAWQVVDPREHWRPVIWFREYPTNDALLHPDPFHRDPRDSQSAAQHSVFDAQVT